jgi:hypothetical protein
MTQIREPVFPGGMERAPEATAGRCGHGACLCAPEAGRRFCCFGCARAPEDSGTCHCGHYGCAGR